MGLSGHVAASAHQRLKEQLARDLLAEQLATQQRQQQFNNEQTLRNQAQEDRRFDADQEWRTKESDARAAERRLASNRWGIEDMERRGKPQQILDALERVKGDASMTPQQRWIEMEASGFSGGDSPEDFETPEERTAREDSTFKRKLGQAEAEEDVRGRVRQRYKDPDDPSELLIGPDGDQKLVTKREAARLIDQGYRYTGDSTRGGGRGTSGRGADAKAAGSSADPVINEIDQLSQQINTGGGGFPEGLWTTAKGAGREAASTVNLDNAVAEYTSLVDGFTPLIARAVGHVGVLTEQDVQSVKRLFPTPRDNKQLRDAKVARVRKIMAAIHGDNPDESARPEDKRSLSDKIAPYISAAGDGGEAANTGSMLDQLRKKYTGGRR
jgi:hypothetical protein